jgi:hypothetical protein
VRKDGLKEGKKGQKKSANQTK